MTRLARELGKPTMEVESWPVTEIERWKHHFDRYPFTIDFLDLVGAHIVQAIVACMGDGKKKHRLEEFLLLREAKKRPAPPSRKRSL